MSATIVSHADILVHLHQRQYDKVIILCQELEIQVEEQAGLADEEVENILENGADIYAIFMLSLLIEGNLNEAKYLWKRSPQFYKADQNNLYCRLWDIGKIMWSGDNAGAVKASMTLAADYCQHILAEHLTSLQQSTFSKLLIDLSSVYTKVSAAMVEELVGIASEEALQIELEKVNWCVENGLVKCKSNKIWTASEQRAFEGLENDLANMEKMSQYVAFLQRPSLKVDLSNKDTKSQNPSTPTPIASSKR